MPVPPFVPENQDHPVAIAWKAIQRIVQDSPHLQRVRTKRLMDGAVDEWMPPSEGELPWLRISPIRTPVKFSSESEYEVLLTVKYELAIQGTRAADMLNFFGAFCTAFSQSKEILGTTVLQYVRSNDIVILEITEAAVSTRIPSGEPGRSTPPPPPFQYAVGALRARVEFNM